MTIYEMREAIKKVYNTSSWQFKVDRMYDDQVIAIYWNFEERGILNKIAKNERPKPHPQAKQVNIFDYLEEKEKKNAL